MAAAFYFRSHLSRLSDCDAVALSAPAVGKVDPQSVGGEQDRLEEAVGVDLTLIVLWKVVYC